jgi:predicted RNA-binding Zn-ribbon protein involved in translation (DUF1610 family)
MDMKRRQFERKMPLGPRIGEPGRGQHIFESLSSFLCPDCGSGLEESDKKTDYGGQVVSCPACGWYGEIGL